MWYNHDVTHDSLIKKIKN